MAYQELVNKINLQNITPQKNTYKNQAATPKQIHCPKHCMRSSSWWSGVKDDQRFICHVNCNVNNCMLIHQSKIQIWEDWKCYRTHTCKVYCTISCLLQIRLLKVSFIPVFHTNSVVSPEFTCCYPGKKHKMKYKYIHLVCNLSCV